MNTKKLRTIIPLLILVLAGVGYMFSTGFGTLSAFGWEDISMLCPLGALGTMIASKTLVPRALVSLVLFVIAVIILGRAFCGWICPVPVLSKLRGAFHKQTEEEAKLEAAEKGEIELTEKDKAILKTMCGHHACTAEERPNNSRYLVLGGALLSTAIFGFPVFCLICPIGLTFALVFVIINLFGAGDVTWSVVVIPVILLLEVVLFRKWCSHICPISALMSLVSKLNKTFKPKVKEPECVETKGGHCGRCAEVCPQGIDPRHPENGASLDECTRCNLCVEACPAHAITIPALPKDKK